MAKNIGHVINQKTSFKKSFTNCVLKHKNGEMFECMWTQMIEHITYKEISGFKNYIKTKKSGPLETSPAKALNLEVSLRHAKEKEKAPTESLKNVMEERNKPSSEINHLQSALHQSKLQLTNRKTDLIVDVDKCVECHANLMRQQSLQIEDLIQTSQYKEQHEEQNVIELEKLLRNQKERARA
ncbi:hypothetical protein EJ110_NYTH23597 [Nymphaea thermarum]|nr:hypothetical protein EJ110_NYTH23597 [Nymphaea thermarum]